MTASNWNVGHIVWRELQCHDPERAKGFYGELMGWNYRSEDMGPEGVYTLIRQGKDAENAHFAGIWKHKMKEAPSAWMPYVSVADVDAATKKATEKGGRTIVPPQDIPDLARFSVIQDPMGAMITTWRAKKGDGPLSKEPPKVGEFCWETLVTNDAAKAIDFYSSVFGWRAGKDPSGAMDIFHAGEKQLADIQPSKGAPSHWATYVVVPELDAARSRAERLGGSTLVPRVEVPQVGSIAFIKDTVGAAIGLFQPQMR